MFDKLLNKAFFVKKSALQPKGSDKIIKPVLVWFALHRMTLFEPWLLNLLFIKLPRFSYSMAVRIFTR